MTIDVQQSEHLLKEGQMWRLNQRYVRIIAVEGLCVRFKLLDAQNMQEERTLTGDIDTLSRYLLSRNGEVILSDSPQPKSDAAGCLPRMNKPASMTGIILPQFQPA